MEWPATRLHKPPVNHLSEQPLPSQIRPSLLIIMIPVNCLRLRAYEKAISLCPNLLCIANSRENPILRLLSRFTSLVCWCEAILRIPTHSIAMQCNSPYLFINFISYICFEMLSKRLRTLRSKHQSAHYLLRRPLFHHGLADPTPGKYHIFKVVTLGLFGICCN